MRPRFRFEDLEIWQRAVDMAARLHRLADRLDRRKMYRYAEQMRGAALSLPNNIAEGSGSVHAKEFKQYLNIARRSLFENASMLLVFERLGLIGDEDVAGLLTDCDRLSRMVTLFARSLSD